MGGSAHPQLGVLGVMSAKNTAVNILILSTYMSFLLFRRTGKRRFTVAEGSAQHGLQFGIFAAHRGHRDLLRRLRLLRRCQDADRLLGPAGGVGAAGHGRDHGARRLPLPQRRADRRDHWGKMPAISQYTLIFIAISFTWLMGLMGYVRSGLRQHWHVYGVVRDNSADAFTPTLGFATQVVSVTVLIFFFLIGVVFWLSSLSGKPDWDAVPESGQGSGARCGWRARAGHREHLAIGGAAMKFQVPLAVKMRRAGARHDRPCTPTSASSCRRSRCFRRQRPRSTPG